MKHLDDHERRAVAAVLNDAADNDRRRRLRPGPPDPACPTPTPDLLGPHAITDADLRRLDAALEALDGNRPAWAHLWAPSTAHVADVHDWWTELRSELTHLRSAAYTAAGRPLSVPIGRGRCLDCNRALTDSDDALVHVLDVHGDTPHVAVALRAMERWSSAAPVDGEVSTC